MKKGDLCEAVIERIEFPNHGMAKVGEERVVVKNAIPGQRVRFVINKKRHGKAEGRLLEVLERSPLEQEEGTCPHFGQCGGCLYQSLPYEEQLAIKSNQVKTLIEGVCDPASYVFEGIKGSPICAGYRNKMEFSFGDEYKDGPLALGMHKRGSFYDIVTTTDCRIVHPDFCRILEATLEYFREAGVSFYRKLQHEGYLRHLLVRRAVKTGEILVALVTSGQTDRLPMAGRGFSGDGEFAFSEPADRTETDAGSRAEEKLLGDWRDRLLSLPLDGSFAGILHIRNDSLADVVQSDETTVLYGKDYFYEELLGLRFRITPFSFFQTNSLGAEVLYETVRDYVGETKGKVIFDLYSGTGTIAQMIAPVADKVIGVEIVEEAVVAARENAALNGLGNCEFIAGDVLKVIDEVADKPDLVILDPPRDGIHPKALDKIIRYGVDRIVYISCKPTSLVRDLGVFMVQGYRLEKACAVDMFPATSGIETVVQLSKGEINSKKVRVEFSLEDMDMSGFQKGATYGQIKDYVKEHTGLSVSSLYIAQVKQKYGIIERENYNKPKSENTRQPQCPPEKEAAITEALKHFRMI